jgi:hypothetical protein
MHTTWPALRVLVATMLVATAFSLALHSAEARTVVTHVGCDLHAEGTEAPGTSATAAAGAHHATASLPSHDGETCCGIGCNVAVPHCPTTPQRRGNDSDQVTPPEMTAMLGFEPPALRRPPRD